MHDVAVAEGKTALLLRDFQRMQRVRKALEEDEDAAPLLFGKGESEVTYTWEWEGVPCKARIDRLADDGLNKTLVHLKTSRSANPRAFEQVGASLGYALACAWYLDGWHEQGPEAVFDSYCVVVVSSKEPILVTVGAYDHDDMEDARTDIKHALAEFRRAKGKGVWRKYGDSSASSRGPGVLIFHQPAWYRRRVADLEGINRG
jgi:hypothetical protein